MADLSSSVGSRDLSALIAAVRRNRGAESRHLSSATWQVLSGVLLRRTAEAQTCLIRQGDPYRNVYFVESGLLRVYRSEDSDRLLRGVIGAGWLAGEGAFFAPVVRAASVEAIEHAVVWELPRGAFEQMAENQPQHALAVVLYLGSVLSARKATPAGRLTVT